MSNSVISGHLEEDSGAACNGIPFIFEKESAYSRSALSPLSGLRSRLKDLWWRNSNVRTLDWLCRAQTLDYHCLLGNINP